jgi:cytochrome c-type biogenesis protein CcmF
VAPGPAAGERSRRVSGAPVMIAEFGHFVCLLAFALAIVQAVAGLWGGHAGDKRAMAAAGGAAEMAAIASVLAFAALIHAYLVSDFSVANVAANSHTLKPLLYKIAGAWGNHEGSFLLWCMIVCVFGALAARFAKSLRPSLLARVVGVQGIVAAASFAYLVFASNPFLRLDPAPLQGADLNPLLQDPALAAHPPFLYLGYVGFSLVFSFAVAGLLEGKVDAAWARWVRPWALASWAFLTVGIALGSYWAYYELGWGGWWFWDPVENASFMPWLLGAALLHSAIVTEKRGALASWTILLSILTFSLSLLGTFLVRSGVLTSVHAFALDPERGVWILVILGVLTGGALALYAWRAPKLGSDAGLFAPVSREGALVLNNLFLTVACATVLAGTLYPLAAEAVTGRTISVGPPYFNATFNPLMMLLLIALPVAPYLAWKRGDVLGALQRLWAAGALALVGALVALAFYGAPVLAGVGFAVALWLIFGALWELGDRLHIGRAGAGGVLARLRHLPGAAWGMALAHLGVGVFMLGAVAETSLRSERSESLALGQSTSFAGRTVTLDAVRSIEGPNYYGEEGVLTVTREGGARFEMHPERRFYPAAQMPTTEVAIRAIWGGDFYVALGEPAAIDGQEKWTVRLYWNPMIHLVFVGCGLMALGGAISLSDRRLRVGAPTPAKAKRRRRDPAPAPIAAE